MGRKFTVTVPKTFEFEEGWGVDISPSWTEDETIADIEVTVVPIVEHHVKIVGDVPCVLLYHNAWCPVENFERLGDPGVVEYDDTHDLRNRFFETEAEANDHAEFTRSRFEHPQVWESFVRL